MRTLHHRSEVRTDEHLAAALDAVTRSTDFDTGRALTVAAEVERGARGEALRMRARLLRADALDRLGDIGAGAQLAWEVNRWATEHDDNRLLALSHRQLSSTYHYLGDAGACLDHAVRCAELLDSAASPRERGLALVSLADALGWVGSFDEARRRYTSAEEIFVSLRDVPRQLLVLNNRAITEHEAGEPERAWAVTERMRQLAAVDGRCLPDTYLDAVARTQISVGRPADAERTLLDCLADRTPGPQQADLEAETLLTLALAQRLTGGTDRAQDTLDRCHRLCAERGLAEVAVRAREEQAELYAAAGDFARAFRTYKTFHAEADALRSSEREARARIREAMFATAEARQDAARFREQARRDPLTGLRNRRFVDERLPVLLGRAAQGDCPMWVALVDIDHFKRINDRYSHGIGDRVLVIVSGLLGDAVGGPDGDGLVARMGGEEFLVVMPDTTAEVAARRLDKLRLAVRSYPWRSVADKLAVTISVGAAPARGDSTQSSLLGHADKYLYEAKHAGRDRVVLAMP
jgi:diguanylate cyclase (GGDEF)-like protein